MVMPVVVMSMVAVTVLAVPVAFNFVFGDKVHPAFRAIPRPVLVHLGVHRAGVGHRLGFMCVYACSVVHLMVLLKTLVSI
jgi:hypothetical protein